MRFLIEVSPRSSATTIIDSSAKFLSSRLESMLVSSSIEESILFLFVLFVGDGSFRYSDLLIEFAISVMVWISPLSR